jgi:hypothetical protein
LTLVFAGERTTSADTETFAFGFRDEGSFSALPPFCEAGHAVDVERRLTDRWMTALRRFDCGNEAGTILARTWLLGGDPSSGYEEGAWLIVSGTGTYERLRGKGAYVRAFLQGTSDGSSRSTAEMWDGVVDFDDVPPQVTVLGISVERPQRRDSSYRIRVAFRARDALAGPVSYFVTAKSSVLLAAKYGIASSGTSSVALDVRPAGGERTVRLGIEASDRVGNLSTIVRTRVLPRPRRRF